MHLARTFTNVASRAGQMGKKGKGAAPPTVTPPETRTIFNRGEQYLYCATEAYLCAFLLVNLRFLRVGRREHC